MNAVDLAALGLATWRVSSILVQESGPRSVFERFREWLGIRHEDGMPASWPGDGLAALFSCVWCISVWVAPVMYVLWRYWPPAVYVLAASTLAVIMQECIRRDKDG